MSIKEVVLSVSIVILAGSLCCTIFQIVDKEYNNSKEYNKIWYGSDCKFIIPNGYKIVYSQTKKEYAVAVLNYSDYFLYNTYTKGITPMFSSIAAVSTFDDSCAAKGYLKAYIKSIEPKMTTFK